MAYGDTRKRKKRDILGTQIEVYNVHSGRLVTMDDDGCSKETGQANQQRAHVLRKLAQKDADGDPIFVLKQPLAKHTLDADRFAGGGQELAGRRELEDRSRADEFETLADKYAANMKARENHMRDFAARRYKDGKAPGRSQLRALPPAIDAKVTEGKKAAAKKASKQAIGAIKTVKPEAAA